MAFSELDLIISMFHKNIFPLAKSNIEYLKKKYEGQVLNKQLIGIIDGLSIDDEITEQLLEMKLSDLSISDSIKDKIRSIYGRVQKYTPAEIDTANEMIIKAISTYVIENTYEQYKNNPVEFIDKLKVIDVGGLDKTVDEDIYSESNFSSIDIHSVIDELKGSTVKSSMNFINQSYSLNGYFSQQLIAIVGPPGSGKSLFMMNEAVNFIKQGKKVLYTAIGDLNRFDFVSRMSSIITDTEMSRTTIQLDYYYPLAIKQLSEINNLRIQFIAPDELTSSDYISILKKKGYYDDYDVFIIDYDTNFKSEEDMYQKGDEIYNSAKLLASREGKLVLIGCQPKIGEWGNEVIGLTSLSESSRKQHIVDMVITISHIMTPRNANHIGVMNICKSRRGSPAMSYYFMDKTGRFYEISQSTYSWLCAMDQSYTYKGLKAEDRV